MSIYFDFKTISELTGENYYRQQKEFTLKELAKYDGRNGRPSYVSIEGIVYDVSKQSTWSQGKHFGLEAGQDLTNQFNSCHRAVDILMNAPKVGILIDEEINNMNGDSNASMNRQINQQQDTSNFTPDDWVRYITPLVVYALREPNQGMSEQRIYQKVAMLGVLVGLGRTPQDAINQLQQWQNTGASQLLTNGTTGTGPNIAGGIGTAGGVGTGTGPNIAGGIGTAGGVGTGIGPNTAGGIGTAGGVGTGIGPNTAGGVGIAGGIGTGIGPNTAGGIGTAGGVETGTGIGTRDRLDLE